MDDDDPFNWGVDKVVRELWIPSPEVPPAEQLEASLHEQRVNGHTILTYPNESKLCENLVIPEEDSYLDIPNLQGGAQSPESELLHYDGAGWDN
ncbi:hypothetical protein F4802DRAFT_603901 [Xylaria palmicola]|nr:hypothetical protein F4802DRAFT_603901 [Xylaria palmicola]